MDHKMAMNKKQRKLHLTLFFVCCHL